MPEPDVPSGAAGQRPRRPRWGVRTLSWLALVIVCLLTSNALYSFGVDYWGLLPLAGTVIGLCAAAYCSYRGLRSASWLGR